jgi:flagellar biosynthesis chaperone FliJ
MMIQTYRQSSERWEGSYNALMRDYLSSVAEARRQLDRLETQLNQERRAWRAEVARARTRTAVWVILAGGIACLARR